jgi:hypothetical protein
VKYEAYITETHFRMLTGEGIAMFRRNQHTHLERSPTDAQAGISSM